jgi:16S rRNA (guanine1516-N2)-methyltransferase
VQVTFIGTMSAADFALCRRFGIETGPTEAPGAWTLRRIDGRLCLRAPPPTELELALDLQRGQLGRRLRTSRRNEPLARAVGLGRGRQPTVIDATAGFGRDALVLAQLGVRVHAIERVPVLAAILADMLADSPLQERLSVECGNASEVLRKLTPEQRPDVVYLDPMFEVRRKAEVQKPAQILRRLAACTTDVDALLDVALLAARERVVIKRHPHMQPVRPGASSVIQGGRVRFDVYLVTRPGSAGPAV